MALIDFEATKRSCGMGRYGKHRSERYMGNLIAEQWNNKERRLPGIDCIAFPDGRITILNHYSLYDPTTNEEKLFCRPLCDTTIDSIENYGATYWTRVDEWASIPYQDGKILGGDGSMGNQGFIAYIDHDDRLLWGIFFEHTNPIKSLEIKGRILIATNEHSELQVKVNLDVLTDIEMIEIKDR